MYRPTVNVGCMLIGALAVLGLAATAGATLVLEGDEETAGEPLVYMQDVVLGTPATITLRTTLGGSPGANISIAGSVNDDAAHPTHLFIDAGTAGVVSLEEPVGELVAVGGLTINSAISVQLKDAHVQGPGGVNLNAGPGVINLAGNIVTNGAAVTINSNGVNLAGNIVTNGGAITINSNVVLGMPAMVTLDSSGGGGGGGNISIVGTVVDDVLSATTLVLKAGTGNVTLQGTVGAVQAPAGLTVGSANQVSLPTVTTAGPISVTATKATVNGTMASGGSAVALNATTVDLKALIQTGGGALSGTASTVNVTTAASLQNAVDVAAAGATLNCDAGTYDESVTVGKALTMTFTDDSTIKQTLTVNSSVGLGGAAKSLSVHALSISNECHLDVADVALYVDGDVEGTLDGWISDGRLSSSVWGASIDAAYVSGLGRTEVTPEPATLALVALGGLGALLRRRRG